ncbi:hypothetical protein [Cellulosimicrobium arenosum]|uniref:Integral membrane protein n=1 Tax=Cellulosimicrobium arenosum TaxID=2708133 RepID=A0A927G8Z0_9MICO|nr:hypothetical protein [Cellulosimicrobium arenosum]MBD8078510.1 hypothetical protein [Cellulosimicrobium arenosum]
MTGQEGVGPAGASSPSGGGAPRSGGRARRHLTIAHVPEMLYGAVVSASVLAVASVHAPPGDRVVVVTAVVAVVYWLAHVYVAAVGGRFADPDHSTGSRVLLALRENWAVLLGAVPPIVVTALARLFGADSETSAWIALWFTVLMLTAVGGAAAWTGGARRWALAGEMLVAGCFGLLVVALKYALH